MALTRDDVFWNAFSNHAKCAVDATALLANMLEKPAEAKEIYGKIERIESEGDRITHDVVVTLHQTWITPLDREWIHGLITTLDDVLDFVDSAGEHFVLYEISETREDALELAKTLAAATVEMAKAVDQLPKLKNAPGLLESCKAIAAYEKAADRVYRRAIGRLFKENTEPLLLMKWRDVYDQIEESCDRVDDVANIIEGIVLEHA